MILFRYICREIFLCMLIIVIILVSVLVINEFSHFLKEVAAGRYSIGTAMTIVALQLPALFTYVLPLALFLGILIGIGRLYTDNEMTVMTACGMSLMRQVVIVLSLAIVVAGFSAWLSVWVGPRAMWFTQHLKLQAINNFKIGTLVPHRFEDFGTGRVVYVEQVDHGRNKVKDVFLALASHSQSVGDPPKWDIVKADEAYQATRPDTSGKFIVVKNGTRFNGAAGTATMTVSQFNQYGVNILSDLVHGQNYHKRTLNHKELTFTLPMSRLAALRDHDKRAAAEWQLRLAIPISVLISAMIAVAMSKVDPRRGSYVSMLPAIVLYIFYATMIFLSRAWIEKGVIPSYIGMWWIHGTMFIVMLALFAWRVGWDRTRLFFRIS
ncbi:MAG: LPS export ABC transporter permease LptF [Coxiella sp. (in: Bacteria)]|nr:MAG: LPS export ABC transporter permease LptF [Coxiella sp. (in: g-proteobacteria)]